jgi:hypothetical protein
MFEQYNVLQKILRIIIFAILIIGIVLYVPDESLGKEDTIKVVCSVLLVFVIYDFYYPAVKIELKKDNEIKTMK